MTLEERAASLPQAPGVYLFKDAQGQVLYVGKAINLRARVNQYLSGHDERFMVRFLVRQSADVDAVLTHNEKEALILENTLIKRHQPPYNVKLRDDKNFLHLRIDPKAPWPRFTIRRRIQDDGARWFGPYASAQKARHTLAFIGRAIPLRTCSDAVLRSRTRPCILHEMGRCVAPCVPGKTTEAAYSALVQEACLLLEGRRNEAVERLRARMMDAAEREAYEEAAAIRDLLREVESTLAPQKVVDRGLADRDVWGFWREGDRGVAAVVPVREGLMLEPRFLTFENELGEDPELLASLLNSVEEIPPEILLPFEPTAREALEEVLAERRGGAVELRVPQRGDKLKLVELARDNARDRFRRSSSAEDHRRRALEELGRVLGMPAPPNRLECFDNSNIQGQNPVASQVTFIDGVPAKKEYRHYKVREVTGADDFSTMAEILRRRFQRAAEDGIFPDLLVVDGGRGQLAVARAVLAELGLEDQPVIGFSKPRTEKRKARRGEAVEEADLVDKIVIWEREEPIRLPDHHPALNLLRHLRDEAHRFAITFHRQQRQKSALLSVLDGIEGVGPARRKALLTHFGSAKGVAAATLEELREVVGPQTAQKVWAALHP